MNQHRLYRNSKKIQGRGFFSDLGYKLLDVAKKEVEDQAQQLVKSKLQSILNKKLKKGSGLKFYTQ